MPLSAGTRLGPYEVLGLVGAGGMGEVYRGRDTLLSRGVAIKVLPATLAADSERLARFQREAELLASLNHQHIAQVYGLIESPNGRALVMELVEGNTLEQRLRSGRLPITTAITLARQGVDAIEAAHEKGVIHRDLKPANIMITPEGHVKVLDFGLAKPIRDSRDATEGAEPTTITGVTRVGTTLGTAAYMSPEQARGEAVDRRTDIWAFGCLLFEMLAGQRAFGRPTTTQTFAAVLAEEPDWNALPTATPPCITHLLHRCLHKDSGRRLRDIGEARVALEEAAAGGKHREGLTRSVAVAVGIAMSLSAIGLAAVFYIRNSVSPVTSPSEYTQLTNFTESAVSPSLSTDGRMLTFKVGEDFFLGQGDIYVKMLPNGESVRLTTGGGTKYGPVFSPDGSRIAYTHIVNTGQGLSWDTFTVPVLGGQPTRLLPNASGLTWLNDGRVLFAEIKTGLHMGIVTATEGRAEERAIYFPAHEGAMAHYAYASPDRRWVLVVEMDQTHSFSSPCRLLPFDGSSAGREIGPPSTCTAAAWSPDGKWMYFGATVNGTSHLWRQKFPDGVPEQITFGPTEEEGVAVAPDGRSLVTSLGTRRSAIWIRNAAGERAITSEGYAEAPLLTSDAKRLFYLVLPQAGATAGELRVKEVSSGRTETMLPGVAVMDYAISADGAWVAYTTLENGRQTEVWVAPVDRRMPPRQLARAADQVSFGAASEVLFRSIQNKANTIERMKLDGTGRQRIASPLVMDKGTVSPDGMWVMVDSPSFGDGATAATVAVPTRGGAPRTVCVPVFCSTAWSADGKFLYVSVAPDPATTFATEVLAIPIRSRDGLPELPKGGLNLAAGGVELPGAVSIPHGAIAPGPNPSVYAFERSELQRNLWRIPLH